MFIAVREIAKRIKANGSCCENKQSIVSCYLYPYQSLWGGSLGHGEQSSPILLFKWTR